MEGQTRKTKFEIRRQIIGKPKEGAALEKARSDSGLKDSTWVPWGGLGARDRVCSMHGCTCQARACLSMTADQHPTVGCDGRVLAGARSVLDSV